LIPLTPELAHAMLTIYERRLRDPRGTVYDATILEAALGVEMMLPVDMEHTKQGLRKKRRQDTEWLGP